MLSLATWSPIVQYCIVVLKLEGYINYRRYSFTIACTTLLLAWAMLSFVTVRNSSCGKVMFSQVSVILSTGGREVHGRGLCVVGGMHDRGHVWRGHAWWGAWLEWMAGGGPAWQEEQMVRILLECIFVHPKVKVACKVTRSRLYLMNIDNSVPHEPTLTRTAQTLHLDISAR